MGGELEYIDGSTLTHSLAGRQLMQQDVLPEQETDK